MLKQVLAMTAAPGVGRARGTACIPCARNVASLSCLVLGHRSFLLTCAFESPAGRRDPSELVKIHHQEGRDRHVSGKNIVVLAAAARRIIEEQSERCSRQVDGAPAYLAALCVTWSMCFTSRCVVRLEPTMSGPENLLCRCLSPACPVCHSLQYRELCDAVR